MPNYMQLMTLVVNTEDGTFYVSWAEGVPAEYKLQMKATFGSMFQELPEDAEIRNA